MDDETDADAAEDALTHSLRETRALALALLGADSVEEAAAERSELWLQDVEGDTLADRVRGTEKQAISSSRAADTATRRRRMMRSGCRYGCGR